MFCYASAAFGENFNGKPIYEDVTLARIREGLSSGGQVTCRAVLCSRATSVRQLILEDPDRWEAYTDKSLATANECRAYVMCRWQLLPEERRMVLGKFRDSLQSNGIALREVERNYSSHIVGVVQDLESAISLYDSVFLASGIYADSEWSYESEGTISTALQYGDSLIKYSTLKYRSKTTNYYIKWDQTLRAFNVFKHEHTHNTDSVYVAERNSDILTLSPQIALLSCSGLIFWMVTRKSFIASFDGVVNQSAVSNFYVEPSDASEFTSICTRVFESFGALLVSLGSGHALGKGFDLVVIVGKPPLGRWTERFPAILVEALKYKTQQNAQDSCPRSRKLGSRLRGD